MQLKFRLPQPEMCPDNIYNSLLMACWAADTEKRPTFRRILEKLNDFIAEYGEVIWAAQFDVEKKNARSRTTNRFSFIIIKALWFDEIEMDYFIANGKSLLNLYKK